MVYLDAGSARLSANRATSTGPNGRGSMPSSGTFARVGLIAAVSVVVGISTFGSLLKHVTPQAITIGPVSVAATPAPPVPAGPAQPTTESATAETAPSPAASPTSVTRASPAPPTSE